jgi:glucans biosynthesis protein
VPERAPGRLQPIDLEYRVLWQGEAFARPPLAWVAQTRRGRGYSAQADDSIGFVIDWRGAALEQVGGDAPLVGVVSTDANATVLESIAHRHDVEGGVRLVPRLRRIDKAKPVELRAYLKSGDRTLSETWSYVLPPD